MAKRADGEGSIFQLADGRWAAEVDLGYQNGRRKRKRVTAKTQAEVLAKMREVQTRLNKGLDINTDNITVGKFLQEWLELVKRTRTYNTYKVREQDVRLYIKPALEKTKVSKLTVMQVQKLLFNMADKGYALNTISGAKGTLQTALKEAERQNIVIRNVAALAHLPEARRVKEKKALSIEDAKKLLELIKGDEYELPLTIMLSLGLRIGETLGLKPEFIEYETHRIYIGQNLQRRKGEFILQKPKTKSSMAYIPLPENLARLLKVHQAQQALKKRIAGDDWQEHGLVFTREKGEPIYAQVLAKRFTKLLQRNGWEHITPHELRHSCASILFAQGVDPKIIQAILRHSKLSITMDLYTHLMPGAVNNALDGIDRLLKDTG